MSAVDGSRAARGEARRSLAAHGFEVRSARRPGCGPLELARDAAPIRAERLHEVGAVLFRGYGVLGEDAFEQAVQGVTPQLLDYDYASTPRTRRRGQIYTSTEYPSHQSIPLHGEMSYARRWPRLLWFACLQPAQSGGATPLADARRVYRALDPAIRRRFEERGVRYVRNYGTGLDLGWERAFDTRERSAVEAYCARAGLEFEWRADGVLRTVQVCPATVRHPQTQVPVWFNQAHLFHVSALEPETREALRAVVEEPDLPRHAYYGDGAPIEDAVLGEIRAAYDACQVEFAWSAGDVLLLDNVLVAHGRTPYRGPRSVLVAMA